MGLNYKNSGWSYIKVYINNNYKIGDIISRQTLIKNLVKVPKSTIDSYRAQLTIIGIVEKTKPGKYKLLCKIPEDMNTMDLMNLISEVREYPWKKWFIPTEERIKNGRFK